MYYPKIISTFSASGLFLFFLLLAISDSIVMHFGALNSSNLYSGCKYEENVR